MRTHFHHSVPTSFIRNKAVVTTKPHRPSDLSTTEISFSQSWSQKSKISMGRGLDSCESLFWVVAGRLLAVSWKALLHKGTDPTWPNPFPKAPPPNAITLGTWILTHAFWRDTDIQSRAMFTKPHFNFSLDTHFCAHCSTEMFSDSLHTDRFAVLPPKSPNCNTPLCLHSVPFFLLLLSQTSAPAVRSSAFPCPCPSHLLISVHPGQENPMQTLVKCA